MSIVTAIFHRCAVTVEGGFQHPQKGMFVEIFSKKIPRQSVSVWTLTYTNEAEADAFFEILFGVPYDEAMRIDEKKGVVAEIKILKKNEFKKPVIVIDSKNLSGALGLIVLRAAQAIEAGWPVAAPWSGWPDCFSRCGWRDAA